MYPIGGSIRNRRNQHIHIWKQREARQHLSQQIAAALRMPLAQALLFFVSFLCGLGKGGGLRHVLDAECMLHVIWWCICMNILFDIFRLFHVYIYIHYTRIKCRTAPPIQLSSQPPSYLTPSHLPIVTSRHISSLSISSGSARVTRGRCLENAVRKLDVNW